MVSTICLIKCRLTRFNGQFADIGNGILSIDAKICQDLIDL